MVVGCSWFGLGFRVRFFGRSLLGVCCSMFGFFWLLIVVRCSFADVRLSCLLVCCRIYVVCCWLLCVDCWLLVIACCLSVGECGLFVWCLLVVGDC